MELQQLGGSTLSFDAPSGIPRVWTAKKISVYKKEGYRENISECEVPGHTHGQNPSISKSSERWKKKGQPDLVFVHDFPSMAEGKAIPYGICDGARDEALVNVGITHETAEFAVESTRR